MEIPALQGMTIGQALLPMEKPLRLREQHRSLRIGVPREVANEERRVALAPSGVATLVANGHEVYVEQGAGVLANFPDAEYMEAGAQIVATPEDLYSQCELIVKVGRPTDDELKLLQENQVLISALHLGNTTPDFLRRLMELGVTGIGFEFIRDSDGTLPIVRMMHEIMGSMAVQIAARYLESNEGGKGVMLGGISGVPPATVVIIGAGVVGEWAARTALGFGAHVVVLDTDLGALRAIEHYLDRRVTTAMASVEFIRKAVRSADVVIGAKMGEGQRAPILVTEDMVAEMQPGSVIVDTMIDQGGCIETSRPTTHSNPVFRKYDVIHYCVPNMPSNAARTATYALNNVLVPYLIEIGESGSIHEALWRNVGLRNGTYVYRRHLTKKSLAAMFGLPYRDIELLIASGL
ncbi:alanine dehydrogenase [Rhodothermus marinus]|uniref:alanine dehydrogenase n=2 Tax=Rhodothermus marinus TaxID=29549 RepID=D0MER7_RHOM4|nr:alanine dehydrogenase [Rhodothermus marinus]ACY47367.1 alanine dehydrogenase [Rhodothermus marinus DSM 4252]AEN72406.1 alanine dehydrogenase [Rhodothermus marinus SG0.5JP17-172]MBO2491766.1 alanine dehydrogenase [Rhodothermus marinus]BBM68644.1 alanine dehydrogenase [Rhodothermus marinus]BBM71609.1 alanine dehydrogenase [Rhodothermus marinus]